MKLIISTLSFIISACAMSTPSEATYLGYEKLFMNQVGITTENDIVKEFGKPFLRSEKNDFYTLNYNDHKTGFQRASLNFRKSDSKLLSILWIPQVNEEQFQVEKAKASFKNAHFVEIDRSEQNPHAISKVTEFIDDTAGIRIRHSETRDGVEAISKFDKNFRSPADTNSRPTSIPYTL